MQPSDSTRKKTLAPQRLGSPLGKIPPDCLSVLSRRSDDERVHEGKLAQRARANLGWASAIGIPVGPAGPHYIRQRRAIDAALTFVALGNPSCNARPGHRLWHERAVPAVCLVSPQFEVERTFI